MWGIGQYPEKCLQAWSICDQWPAFKKGSIWIRRAVHTHSLQSSLCEGSCKSGTCPTDGSTELKIRSCQACEVIALNLCSVWVIEQEKCMPLPTSFRLLLLGRWWWWWRRAGRSWWRPPWDGGGAAWGQEVLPHSWGGIWSWSGDHSSGGGHPASHRWVWRHWAVRGEIETRKLHFIAISSLESSVNELTSFSFRWYFWIEIQLTLFWYSTEQLVTKQISVTSFFI